MIEVKQVSPHSIRVGNKIIKKDGSGDWQEVTELTENERLAVANFLITNQLITI
ncbi:hypothetical protein KORDIASMS9_02700 [Kordia sp. SMS9]|uniref:hypothetical protein n=1 Tax=Kordia sp. SMS9 TaxID=2282170 RepID=UPI000E10BA93|nr:hypothetical protein [Kordia sp. SMS9]AXG70460.1 hypothetical protein KORDIASMS9_02700 [Kordia sp. SMS9]